MTSNEKFIIKKENVLSFKLDKETADLYKEFIYYLENEGVYMDFMWYIDDNFCEDVDENIILHIVNEESSIKWENIAKKESHYYKCEQIRVNLENASCLYFIFAPLVLNKITKLVYDFYEGPDCVFMTFLVDSATRMEREERFKEYERREKEEMENLGEEYLDTLLNLDDLEEFEI